MTSLKALLHKDWIVHIPFWVGWILLMNLGDENGFGVYSQRYHNILLPLILNTSLNALFFYGMAWILLPKLYPGRDSLQNAGVVFGFSSLFLLAKTGIEKGFIRYFYADISDVDYLDLFWENLYPLPAFVIFAFVYFFQRKNKHEKNWLIQEKAQKELALLRAQMSPHFLFNTLNNLYSLGMQGKCESVTSGILKLSDLLRYVIYDSQEEKILLRKELSYIRDFIEINKLMFSQKEQNCVTYKIQGDPGDCMIPTMLLITFVENAFKFGIGTKGKTDIEIEGNIQGAHLHFKVSNRICRTLDSLDTQQQQTGLGLAHTKKQLELLYKNQYTLNLQERDDYFKVDLNIRLNL